MQALLDTHTLIWWLLGDSSLSTTARQFISDSGNQIFVSAASAWEIATKHRLGKLPGAAQLATQFPRIVPGQGFVPLPITLAHALRSGSFTALHKNPFDRMPAAQSVIEKIPILSNDRQIDQFGATRVW